MVPILMRIPCVKDMSETALRQIKKTLDDYNMRVCALAFQTRNGYNVVDRLQERIEATKKVMDLAYRLGANVVVNQVGRIPTEKEGPDWNLLIEALSDLGQHAHHCGAFLDQST